MWMRMFVIRWKYSRRMRKFHILKAGYLHFKNPCFQILYKINYNPGSKTKIQIIQISDAYLYADLKNSDPFQYSPKSSDMYPEQQYSLKI